MIERVHKQVIVITGLSGAGKTVALRALEDIDFFCVDNLPVSLISSLVDEVSSTRLTSGIAIGIDIREKEFLNRASEILLELRSSLSLHVLFLEADQDVLIRRFRESRRPHPVAGNELSRSIFKERRSLAELRKMADVVLDTSSLSPHHLRKYIASSFCSSKKAIDLSVNLISFGFKYGVPPHADIVLDARFLPNPFFVPHLRDLNGNDTQVSNFVLRRKATRIFMRKIYDLLTFLLPMYVKEGKAYLSVAIGCTGGNHRSPAIVNALMKKLPKRNNIEFNVVHRDMS